MQARLAALLALALASGARAEVGGAAALGAGFDVSTSLSPGAGPLQDAAFATVHVHLTAEAGDASPFPKGWGVQVAYDGLRYQDLPGQDTDRATLTLAARWRPDERQALRLALTGGWRHLRADGAQAFEVGGAATWLRALGAGVRLGLGAGGRVVGAGDPALSGWKIQARASLLLDPWKAATLAVTGGGALARQRLAPLIASAPVLPAARDDASVTATPEPAASAQLDAPATAARLRAATAGAELSQELGGGLALSAGWLWTRTAGDLPAWESHLSWLELGWTW